MTVVARDVVIVRFQERRGASLRTIACLFSASVIG